MSKNEKLNRKYERRATVLSALWKLRLISNRFYAKTMLKIGEE